VNWEQLRAILWLRWRLTRNQFHRGGQLNLALSILLLAVMLLTGAGCWIGGFALGAFAGAKVPAPVLLLIWDGVVFLFVIFWLSGMVVEIQRSESIDLTKLLHLPVTLQQVFVFNYAASHFTPSIVVIVPGMVGFCAGMTLTGGVRFVLLLPLAIGFVFMVTAWTYCLRGWLAALMTNKRRRRTIIVWITIGFVLLGQLPNLIFNSPLFRFEPRYGPQRIVKNPPKHGEFDLPAVFVTAHAVAPPGWIGYGAMKLKQRAVLPALGLAAAGFFAGALGLIRAYRMTLRFYQGAEGGTRLKPAARREPRADGQEFVERRLPGLPNDTAALTLATFRSLTRAPELKMAFIMPVVMGIILSSMWFTRSRHTLGGPFTGFAATAVVMVAAFSLAPTMANVFGLDRNGFRAFVLLPTQRHQILLAKNLAFFPFMAVITLLLLIAVEFLMRMSWGTFCTGILQIPTAFVLYSLLCNMLSILAPYRLAEGTLKAKKPKAIVFLAVFGTMLLTPVVLLPVLIPPGLQLLFFSLGWLPWLPVNLLSAGAILAGVVCLYRLFLPLQGRLLQRREQIILREVTEEVE
jgi:hypothetical protein